MISQVKLWLKAGQYKMKMWVEMRIKTESQARKNKSQISRTGEGLNPSQGLFAYKDYLENEYSSN